MRKIRQYFHLYQIYVITVAIVVFSFAVSIFVLIPFAQNTYQLYVEFQSLSKDIDFVKKKLAVLESFDEDTLRSSLKGLSHAIPIDKSAASLMTTIERVASENNIMITDLKLGALGALATGSATPKSTSSSLGISAHIVVSGPYEKYLQFLKQVVRVKRLLQIDALNSSYRNGEITSELTISGFYAPLSKTTNSLTSEITALSQQDEEHLNEFSALPDYASFAQSLNSASFEPRSDPFSP